MPERQPIYTIHDLASDTQVPACTIRNWMRKNLVPKCDSHRSDGINYTQEQMKRIIRVREWIEAQLTLPELAERIEVLGERALDVPDPYAGFGWDDDDDRD